MEPTTIPVPLSSDADAAFRDAASSSFAAIEARSVRVSIIVPTRDRDGRALAADVRERVAAFACSWADGATVISAMGTSRTGLTEAVYVVSTSMTGVQYASALPRIVTCLHWLATHGEQDEVAVEIGTTLYLLCGERSTQN